MIDFTAYELASIITSATGLIASLVAGIVAIKKSVKVSRELEKAKQRETYVVCPHCKKKVALSDLDFRLPTGQVDNDLNGVPDVLQ